MSLNGKLKKCGKIAATVRKKAAAGVPVTEIFASIQNYQNAPGSMTTFYKYYREDMDAARGEITEQIANKVIKKALEGDDFKAQELWLTTKGGWSKQQTNTIVDVEENEEEKSNALNVLMGKLGFNEDEKE